MAYDLYPAVDPSYNFPPEVRAALATSTELRNTVVPMTTTLRNNLTAGEKWDGRLILNTTTDRLERWDAGLAGWQQIADILDLAPYTSALLQRPGRNRIINGNFAVNQRAFTSLTTSGTYGLDRWQLSQISSTGSTTYSVQTPALGDLPESPGNRARIATTGQTGVGDYAQLKQCIESVRTLSGKTVTVSFWALAAAGTPKVSVELTQFFGTGGSPSSSVNIYAGQVTLSTVWTRYSVTIAVPSLAAKTLGTADDYLALSLWTSAGSNFNARPGSLGLQSATIDFWGVQVEEGSVATPFEVEDYATNLRRCQRYYWRISGSAILGSGVAGSGTKAICVVSFPTPMRIAPNSGIGWGGTVKVIQPTLGDYAVTALSYLAGYGSIWGTGLDITVASGMTTGFPTWLEPLASTGYVDFTAEL